MNTGKVKEVAEQAAKRASFEIAKLAVGTAIAGAALVGCYRAAASTVRLTDAAIAALSAKVPQGITFAPGWEKAPAMETSVDPKTIAELVDRKAKLYGIDPKTLRGVIHVESSWNPDARNGSAVGLGQLTETTRRKLGYTEADALNPETAIEGAAYWLRKKIDEQGGNEVAGVQSYYCGPRHDCVGAPQGRQYAAKVARAYGSRPPLAPAIINTKRVG